MAMTIKKYLEPELKRCGLDERPVYKAFSNGIVVRNHGIYSHESEIEKITTRYYRAWPFCKKKK